MPSTQIFALCQQLQAGWEELARLNDEENDSRPGAPASAEDLASLRAATPGLPADYLAFLELHDGWREYWYGGNILSAREVAAKDNSEIDDILEIEAENDQNLSNVCVIGYFPGRIHPRLHRSGRTARWWSTNGATVIATPVSPEYLQSVVELQQRHIERVRAKLELLEQGKNPAFRQANERRVIARAVEQLRSAPPPPPAVTADLDCVPSYIRRTQWTDEAPLFQADGASVQLTMSLYLAYNPTLEEMREALRVWRRRFPWQGKVSAALFNLLPVFRCVAPIRRTRPPGRRSCPSRPAGTCMGLAGSSTTATPARTPLEAAASRCGRSPT